MKVFFISMLLLKIVVTSKNNDATPTKGPYKVTLVSVWRCQNTTYPLEKDPSIQMFMWTTNSGTQKVRLLNGNTTVVKETKQVRLKLKSFVLQYGKWKLSYMVNGISCHGILLNLLSKTVGFSLLDPTNCSFKKGSFTFEGMNINSIQHTVASTMEYGQVIWRCELNVGFSTYHCWEFRTITERI